MASTGSVSMFMQSVPILSRTLQSSRRSYLRHSMTMQSGIYSKRTTIMSIEVAPCETAPSSDHLIRVSVVIAPVSIFMKPCKKNLMIALQKILFFVYMQHLKHPYRVNAQNLKSSKRPISITAKMKIAKKTPNCLIKFGPRLTRGSVSSSWSVKSSSSSRILKRLAEALYD